MNEMEERVARAISKHVHIIAGSFDGELAARAAIEAMREPTNEMVAAVGSHWGTALETDWEAMIDAALGKVDA